MTQCFQTGCPNYSLISHDNVCSQCIEYYCDSCITKTPEKSYCPFHSKIYGVTKTFKQCNEDTLAPILKLIAKKNKDNLNKLETVKARMVIERLKNELEDLEFFFNWLSIWSGGMIPGAGSYHYTNIKNNRTFDIYKKYDFGPCNLYGDIITEDQWKYILNIDYITQEQYDERSA